MKTKPSVFRPYPPHILFPNRFLWNPKKGKAISTRSNTKSKPSFLRYKHDLPLPRRLKGLTRTATLTLELIPDWSAFQRTTGFQLRRFINVKTASENLPLSVFHLYWHQRVNIPSFFSHAPPCLFITYSLRIRELQWHGNHWCSAFLIWKSSNPRKRRENTRQVAREVPLGK